MPRSASRVRNSKISSTMQGREAERHLVEEDELGLGDVGARPAPASAARRRDRLPARLAEPLARARGRARRLARPPRRRSCGRGPGWRGSPPRSATGRCRGLRGGGRRRARDVVVRRPAGDVVAVEVDAARSAARSEPGRDAQQRRLAGPVRAEQRDDLAVGHDEADVAQHDRVAVAGGHGRSAASAATRPTAVGAARRPSAPAASASSPR